MALGQDQTVVFQRKSLEFDVNKTRLNELPAIIRNIVEMVNPTSQKLRYWDYHFPKGSLPSVINGKHHTFNLSSFSILFCGKLFRGLSVTKNAYRDSLPETKCFYDTDSIMSYLRSHGVTNETITNRWDEKTKLTERFDKFFNRKINLNVDWLIENKVSVVYVGNHEVIINPVLKGYEFFKVYDAYTCWSELDMWISGTLSYPQNIMIDIEDKYKVIEHGFDPKYGFRTRPKA
jgi:hypothetical protein